VPATSPNGGGIRDPEFQALVTNLIMHRAELMRQSLEPGHNLDKDCNYPEEPTPSDYQKLYDRLGPATRVVQVYPRECWQVQPTVYEDEDPDVVTTFEEAWDELGQGLRSDRSFYQDEAGSPVWEYLLRADELSGVGQYGAILLGLNDGLPLNEPAQFVGPAATILRDPKGKALDEPTQNYRRKLLGSKKPGARRKGLKAPPAPHKARLTFNQPAGQGRRLTFIRIFPETAATISKFDEDLSSPRFGQPTEYTLTFASPVEVEGRSVNSSTVHWTRIIHVADNLAANEIYGVPRQRPVFNNLLDLRKLYGGSAEMYWRGAFPGYALESLPQFGTEVDYDEEKINSMMFRWASGLQRHLLLTGLSMKGLSPQVVDPRSQIEVHIEAICIQLGIPVRVFKGTERGELASSQDDAAWNDRLRQRQSGYLTPRLIVPFVDRLIALGVLPAPAGYSVWWPDLTSQSDEEQSTIAAARTGSVVQYADSAGARGVIAPHDYWTRIQGYSEEEAASIVDAAEKERKRLEAEKKKADEETLAKQQDLLDQQRQADEARARANGNPPPGGPPQVGAGGNTPPRTPIANYSPTQARDEHGRFLSGGGSYTPEQVRQAKEKLARMPAEEKQYKHFPDDPRDEIEMKQFGFQGRRNAKGGAVPNHLDEPKKFKEVELDPSKVKIHNVQPNVIRDEVEKKLDQGRSADRPLVIKHGDEYTLVDGNHRAAADVLATGKLIALVTERTGKNKFKAPTVNAFCPTGPGGGIDPHCSPNEGGGTVAAPTKIGRKDMTTDAAGKELATTTEKLMEVAAARVAPRWSVSEPDLRTLLKEEGVGKDFENYKGDELKRSAAEYFIRQWASSSGHPVAVAAVSSVANSMGLDYKLLKHHEETNAWINSRPELKRATDSLGKAIYDSTQDWLVERGIKELEVHRVGGLSENRLFSSWSTTFGGARAEGGAGERVKASVPAKYVFSLAGAGFGTLHETEAVLLPRPKGTTRVLNAFCPTGPGGGVDPTCSPKGTSLSVFADAAASHSSAEVRERAGAAVEHIAGRLTDAAAARVAENVRKVEFHETVFAVEAAVRRHEVIDKQLGKETLSAGGAFLGDDIHEVHILSGYMGLSGSSQGDLKLQNPEDVDRHVLAHEIGHAIDGPKAEYSSDRKWISAWLGEVGSSGFAGLLTGPGRKKVTLTKYAKESPSEGFAEFSRLLHGSDVPLADVERKFPRCIAYWRSKKLWP
jgi:hypothetical protein